MIKKIFESKYNGQNPQEESPAQRHYLLLCFPLIQGARSTQGELLLNNVVVFLTFDAGLWGESALEIVFRIIPKIAFLEEKVSVYIFFLPVEHEGNSNDSTLVT